MSERLKLDERIRHLEREVEELKAHVAVSHNGARKPGLIFSAPMYREAPESARSRREAERDFC
jgi:hypothetical protein